MTISFVVPGRAQPAGSKRAFRRPGGQIAVIDANPKAGAWEDALTGIVWEDDAQVVRQHVAKVYCDRDEVRVDVERVMLGVAWTAKG